MPQLIVAAGVSAGVSTAFASAAAIAAAGGAMAFFTQTFATTLILGAVSQALAEKPEAPSLQGQTVSTRNPVAPHNVIYGRTRVGGNVVYMAVSDKTVSKTREVWSGGEDGEYVTTSYDASVANAYLHIVIAIAGHEIDAVEQVFANEEALTFDGSGFTASDSTYGNKIRYQVSYGDHTTQPFPDLVTETSDLGDAAWTNSHLVRGSALAYIRLEYDVDKFPNGVPNFSFKVRGKKVYDPRTSSTAWSANSALCLNDYLTSTRYGLGCVYADEIDSSALVAAANVCDEDVALDAGGTENRYECHGVFSTGNTPSDIINRLLSSMAGKAVWSQGKWKIIPGVYYTPEITFTEDDLRAGMRVQTLVSRRESFNAVKGKFSSSDDNYVLASFPQVVSSAAVTEDGEEVFKSIELPFTTSASMAQRLAKIELLKARQQITLTLSLKLQGLKAAVGDIVNVTNTRLGWSAKKFEVVGLNMVLGETPGVDLDLREISTDVFDWSTSEEQAYDPAPNTTLPNAFSVGKVTNVAFDLSKYYQNASGAITWDCDDSYASNYKVVIDGSGFEYDSSAYNEISNIELNVTLIGYENIGQKSFAKYRFVLPFLNASHFSKFDIGYLINVTGDPDFYDVDGINAQYGLTIRKMLDEYVDLGVMGFEAVKELNYFAVQQNNLQKLVMTHGNATNITTQAPITEDSPSASVYIDDFVADKSYGAFNIPPGPYRVTVTPINVLGVYGSSGFMYLRVPPPPLPSRVSGLELDLGEDGQANATEWTGKDVKIKWRHASFTTSYEVNDQEGNGAEDGMPDPFLKDYKVAVYNGSGDLLREEFVTTNAYVYSYEKNAEDAAKKGDNVYRTLSFKVWARGVQNQISEQAASL